MQTLQALDKINDRQTMNKMHYGAMLSLMLASGMAMAQRTWTLQECIDHALANNIQLQQKRISVASSHEDVTQSKHALLPSVSFSTNQNGSWRPYAESTITLTNGSMTTHRNTMSYNGSYGINANWSIDFTTCTCFFMATVTSTPSSRTNSRRRWLSSTCSSKPTASRNR